MVENDFELTNKIIWTKDNSFATIIVINVLAMFYSNIKKYNQLIIILLIFYFN